MTTNVSGKEQSDNFFGKFRYDLLYLKDMIMKKIA